MKIGFARADITPSLGTSLCGYGYYRDRDAKSVHDALYVSSTVFCNGKERLVLINYDLIGLKVETVKFLKEKFKEELGLDSSLIIVAATHTHSGPNTCLSRSMSEPCSDSYLNKIVECAVEATRYAWMGASKVTSFKTFIDSSFPGIGFNRVLRDEGPIDNSLRGVLFCREGRRPLALINYACHPVTLGVNEEISADYPGAVIAALDQVGFDGVFLNGFCGDIDPLSNKCKWGSGGLDAVRNYGRKIVSSAIRGLLNGTETDLEDVIIRGETCKVMVPIQSFDKDELLNLLSEARKETSPFFRAKEEWVLTLLKRLEMGRMEEEEEIEVTALRLGDIFIVGLPGEIFTQVGVKIRQAYPYKNICTIGNANGTVGYIPTQDDIQRKGYAGYGSSIVYDRQPFLSGVAERLTDEAIRLIGKL